MEEDVLKNVDMCAKYLAKQLVDTNAETFTYTLENFSFMGEIFGDVEVVVVKKSNPTNQ